MKKSELAEKTKLELLDIARKAGLAGRSKMDKDELVSSLAVLLKKETKKPAPSKKSGSRPAPKARLKVAPVKKPVKVKGAVKAKKVTTTTKVTPKKESAIVNKVVPIKKPVSVKKPIVAVKKPVAAKKTGPAKEKVQIKKSVLAPKPSAKEVASSLALVRKSEAPTSVTPVKVAPLLKKSSINKNSVPVKVVKGAIAAIPSTAGKAERWQEKVEDTKFYLGAEERAFIGGEELPAGYGDNRVVLMARDPHWAYVYWEINSEKIAEAKRRLRAAFDDSRLILRVYDITGIEFDGKNAHCFFDIEIPNILGNWYVPLGTPNRTFCIDIGYREAGGGLFPLSRSNKVTSPRDTFSEVLDEEWVGSDEEYKKICAMSGGVGHAGASAELAEMMKKRLEKERSSAGVRGLEPKETSSKH